MRVAAILFGFVSIAATAQQTSPSLTALALPQRLDRPQHIASTALRLTDFVGFIATSFKVPMLVEMPVPVPDLKFHEGTYSARELLDLAVKQLNGFNWEDNFGVAHLYNRQLVNSRGNLLNVRIHRFTFPHDVAEFLYLFRPCIHATVEGYDCAGGAFSGIQPADLKQESLPSLETFKDVPARQILLSALKANGRFYVLIAFESRNPKLASQFPYLNWNSRSLVPSEPLPLWIQKPQSR